MGEEEGVAHVRKKKHAEQQRLMEARKAEEQLKTTLRIVLEEAAYNRITNVKLANPQLFLAAAQNILGIYKRIERKITDNELLTLLRRLKESNEKETKISFERK
ncbi:hypothetical protein J4450_08035 [Candidatus Micrarchaeota archaeon]|nr:hypothetical protein [Candidatus Micrarchaeota archaeon]